MYLLNFIWLKDGEEHAQLFRARKVRIARSPCRFALEDVVEELKAVEPAQQSDPFCVAQMPDFQ